MMIDTLKKKSNALSQYRRQMYIHVCVCTKKKYSLIENVPLVRFIVLKKYRYCLEFLTKTDYPYMYIHVLHSISRRMATKR